jgi:integrase
VGKNANGEGSITYDKKRRRHRVRVTIETPAGPVRKHVGWFRTRVAANEAKIEALSRGGRRRLSLEAEKVTVAEYLEDWLQNTSRVNVTEGIQRQRQVHVRDHLSPYIGSEKLAELRSVHVRLVKQELLEKGLAPNTVGYILGTLSTALNQAVDDELIPRNPASSVRKPKSRGAKMRVLSAEQAAALVDSVRGTRYEALYAVAVWLGPRQGELAALTWADVNPEKRLLRIWRSVNTDRAGEIWSATKSGEEREIILPENIAASLIRHSKIQAEEKLAAGRSWKNPDLVFPNTRGGVNRRATVYENFQRHRERAGLPEMRFHDLRDTAGTLMIRGGVDVRTVADILGHADPAMTLRRYAHVLPDMRERAASVIDSYAL